MPTAPVATTRQSPLDAKMLEDGYRVKITFANLPDAAFWDKAITPPALMGGDAIDLTTQFNEEFVTKAFQQLIEVGETTVTAAWDPKLYAQIKSTLINKPTTITLTWFARKKQLAFYGGLREFTPGEMSRGSQPEAELVIEATNRDANGEEAGFEMYDLP